MGSDSYLDDGKCRPARSLLRQQSKPVSPGDREDPRWDVEHRTYRGDGLLVLPMKSCLDVRGEVVV